MQRPPGAPMPFARYRSRKPQKPQAKGRSAAAGRPLAKAAKELGSASWLALAALVLFWPRRTAEETPLDARRIARLQPGHGRMARAPSQIPPRGWRDILWRTWREFNKDNIPSVAGSVTFFALLALFPGLAAFVTLYGLFADFHDAVKHIEVLAVIAPRDAVVFIGAQMIRISEQRNSTLSIAFVVSLVLSLWSANGGMKAFINGLNVAYREEEKRDFLKLNLESLAFTLSGLVFLLVAVLAVVILPVLMPGVDHVGPVLSVLLWPSLVAVMILALAVLIAWVTVFWQSFAVARAKPAGALRYE